MIQQVLQGNNSYVLQCWFLYIIHVDNFQSLKFIYIIVVFRSDDMLRYELESRGDMDGTDDSSNYHYCLLKHFKNYFNILVLTMFH